MQTLSRENQGPLAGRTILITRAIDQRDEMAERLASLGAEILHRPAIEIVEPSDWSPLDGAIGRLGGYQWIVFTSANGVRFFFKRFKERREPSWPSALVSLAIGPATANALADEGVQVNITASDSRAEGAFEAIARYSGGVERVAGLKFLIPRARVARDFLPGELRNAGAVVDVVEAYRTIRPEGSGDEINALLRDGKIDAITFTSSSTVSNFAALIGAPDLSQALSNVVVACIGPVTATTAREHGLNEVVVPAEFSGVALAEALAERLRNVE